VFFYQNANLDQLIAKSEKVEFVWDTLFNNSGQKVANIIVQTTG